MIAVVPLPAVGADAQDVTALALRDEAELVGDEVVWLRHRIAHEGGTGEGFFGVRHQIVLRQSGVELADDRANARVADRVAEDLQ